MELQIFLVTILLVGFIGVFSWLFDALILNPKRHASKLRKQGIQGSTPSFLLGNLPEIMKMRFKGSRLPQEQEQEEMNITHNYSFSVYPFYEPWIKQYGSTFMFSVGNKLILCLNDPKLVKELCTCTSWDLGRSSFVQKGTASLLGQGLVNADGASWAHQRKIIAPELYKDKVKGMIKIVRDSAITIVINTWNRMIDNGGGVAEIKVDDFMRKFSGDVISKACFGSNYLEGEQIFLKINILQEIMMKTAWLHAIPGFRYLPTKKNMEIKKLEKEIRTLVLKVVNKRQEAGTEKDLLQSILEAASNGSLGEYAADDFIVDNCKSIYIGGYETTAVSATWTLMLLALHPEWQDKVREEVVGICGGQLPTEDMLHKMKMLTMVIYESLRLYPLFSTVVRETKKEMKFGQIVVPKGVNVWVLPTILHHDPNIWGPDVDEFNPERFINGVRKACNSPHAYIPFGVGMHTCVGQQLAIFELKMLLALIVSNFVISISPKYRHSPCANLTIQPEYGVDLKVRRL